MELKEETRNGIKGKNFEVKKIELKKKLGKEFLEPI